MRLNIPLLPFQADIQWRTMPPLRIRIWHWMLAIIIVGALFSVISYIGRLGEVNRFHADKMLADIPNSAWHMAEVNKSAAAIQEAGAWLSSTVLLILTTILIWLVGRLLNRMHRTAERPSPPSP